MLKGIAASAGYAIAKVYKLEHPVVNIVKVEGVDFCDKVDRMADADWGGSTNIEAAFDLMLNVAINNNLKQEDIPATGHTVGGWEVALEPTYEADGKNVQKCTSCSEVLAEENNMNYMSLMYENLSQLEALK
mgnify:CR=1 FL=1